MVQIDAMNRLRELEFDEERFRLAAVPAVATASVDSRALALEPTLAFGETVFGCGNVTLKRRAIHTGTFGSTYRAASPGIGSTSPQCILAVN